jgi:hypothetical protein
MVTMFDLPPAARLPLLVLGMLSLLGGVLAGLARLDWTMPAVAAGAAGWHGALMISAFLGTVISLERAVAIGRGWAYLAPACAGIGGVALLAAAPLHVVQGLGVAAATVLLAASTVVMQRLVAPFTVLLALAALCWLTGNGLWYAGAELHLAVPWWLAFLVLTIAGERLELNRFLPIPRDSQRMFLLIVGLLLAGAAATLRDEEAGLALFSAGLLALAAWLLRYDIAQRNMKRPGLTGFIAHCLLAGYAWLGFAGVLGLMGGFLPGHPWRDATLHAVALGFVFSMIFGHAPIILPTVLRIKIPWHPMVYLALVLLHASLVWRVAGSLLDSFSLTRQGGMANAIALLVFVVVMLGSVLRGRQDMPAASR